MTISDTAEEPIAVVTGDGALPRMLVQAFQTRQRPFVLIGFEGIAPEWIGSHDHVILPFEKAGRLFRELRKRGVKRIVFAGAMRRPRLNPLRFDLKAVAIAPRVLSLLRRGDDETLRGLMAIFEEEGYVVDAPHDHLEELLAQPGVQGTVEPSPQDRDDAERAMTIVSALGQADVGQACVVAGGVCLGVESVQGTDAMLRFVAETGAAYRAADDTRSGVVFKAPKPGQDWRVDLPAIGPATLRHAADAKLSAVVLDAGGVLVLGLEETVAEADRLGLALWVRERA